MNRSKTWIIGPGRAVLSEQNALLHKAFGARAGAARRLLADQRVQLFHGGQPRLRAESEQSRSRVAGSPEASCLRGELRRLLMPHGRRRSAFALATLLWSAGAFAQVTTAVLQGQIKDDSGAVVPGATVTARNVETGASRSVVSDSQGLYRIAALPVGSYEVKAELGGFAPQVRTGITLRVGQEANVDFKLGMKGVTETLTVEGDAPIVETTKTALGKTITNRQIEDLPVPGRTFTNLAFLSPGIFTNASTGGTAIAANGGTGRNNAFLIDGLTNDEVAVSSTRGQTPLDAIREFQVLSNQFSAEYGQASGAVINVLTRSGTNDLRGRGYFYYRADELTANDPFVQVNPTTGEKPKAPFEQKIFGGFLGGSLKKDKTFFFVNYEHLLQDETAVITVPANVLAAFNQPAQTNFPQKTKNPNILAKLDHRLTPSQTLTFRAQYDDQSQPQQNVGGLNTIERAFDFTRTDQSYALFHTWVISPNLLNEFRTQFAKRKLNWDVEPYCPRCPAINRPSINLGKANNMPQGRDEDRLQFVNALSFNVPNKAGDHHFKAGVDVSFIEQPFFFHSNLDGTFQFATDRPFDPADRTTYPVTYTKNTGDPVLDLEDDVYGAFIQDQWRLTPYFTLNLGVRWDYENHLSMEHDKNNFAPRLHFAWDPFKDGKTSVRGGGGVYYDQVFLNIPINAALATRFVGTTISNPGFPDPFVGGSITTPPPPSTTLFDPDLDTAYTNTYSLGFQREILRDLALTIDGIYARGYHLMITTDTNYTINGSPRQDPRFARKLMVQGRGNSKYKALQVGLDKRFSRRYSFGLAYTLADSKRDTEDFNFNPVDHTNIAAEWAPSLSDARHNLNGSANVDGPWGIKLGLGGSYRSALPYNVTTGLDDNRDTFVNDRPAGGGRNSARGAAVWRVDTRLSKVIKVRDVRFELIADAINVFNHPSKGGFTGNQRSTLFGKPTGTVANFRPRQVQLGARLDF
jgi:hypothetical protein